jgi:hypothetical protein
MDIRPLLAPAFRDSLTANVSDPDALFELCYLSVSADGSVDLDEAKGLLAIAKAFAIAEPRQRIDHYRVAREVSSRDQRLSVVAARVGDDGAKAYAFALCFSLLLGDLATKPTEESFEDVLALALGLSEARAEALRGQVFEVLHAE